MPAGRDRPRPTSPELSYSSDRRSRRRRRSNRRGRRGRTASWTARWPARGSIGTTRYGADAHRRQGHPSRARFESSPCGAFQGREQETFPLFAPRHRDTASPAARRTSSYHFHFGNMPMASPPPAIDPAGRTPRLQAFGDNPATRRSRRDVGQPIMLECSLFRLLGSIGSLSVSQDWRLNHPSLGTWEGGHSLGGVGRRVPDGKASLRQFIVEQSVFRNTSGGFGSAARIRSGAEFEQCCGQCRDWRSPSAKRYRERRVLLTTRTRTRRRSGSDGPS